MKYIISILFLAAYLQGSTQVCEVCPTQTIPIEADPTGGQAPYNYVWSTTETTKIINVGAGTYTVTITDSCSPAGMIVVSQTVTALTPPSITLVPTNGACAGQLGSIDATVTGAPPFTYLWSNSETTEDITGLVDGTYTLTVTDDNGCTSTQSATIMNTGTPLSATIGCN